MQDRLVTMFGGGGFLGRYVAQDLLKAGIRIRIAERNPGDAFFIKPMGGLGQTQFVAADITKPATLVRALEGADAAINFVGILKGDFQKVHVEGARNAAEAAKAAGVRDFVQISAIGASHEAASHYARSKAASEDAVREAIPDAMIMRPSVVFGPEDGFINRFAAIARMVPVMVPVMRPDTKFQPVYVADVADAVVKALLDPAAYRGRTFELGGPQILSMREINRFILDSIGKPDKQIFEVPDAMGRAMARMGFLPGAPISWDQWLSLQSNNVVGEDADGFEAFDIAPRPLAAVADKWLVQYRTHGRFANKAAGEV
ncbi:complex I NDUFA9 subunit family protein [Parasphingopyxis algicola]|uniref:complex I NDUFA9 subunit family protein n=1 Tax=Parasphingopyxis algicola TaxID=2026624 RepID=UPI0015A4A67E|nr:complex I NDUFA9 subunit family protein [Parasphingopyxis algicola]QLC24951.1 complex I NDUFA9 subunit family protein [Parasphingopyxis algicola]